MSYVTVFLASLLGSIHCGAMCGGIALYCMKEERGLLKYHLGRLLTYSIMGGCAGALASYVNTYARIHDLFSLAGIIAFFLLIIFSFFTLISPDKPLVNIAKINNSSVGIGALSVLLPCGWLYSFLLIAFASGSLTSGALLMVAFWAGTVPFLSGLAVYFNKSLGVLNKPKLQRLIVVVTCALSILFHLYSSERNKSPNHQVCTPNLDQNIQE